MTVGGANFTCIALQPGGGLLIGAFSYGQTPPANVTVTLPAAIEVRGDTVGLALDMLVSPSASWGSCGAGAPYAITPTFTLSAFGSSSPAAASQSGAVGGLDGQ